MFTIIIIFLAYIINIFLNRWLNKILYKKDLLEILPNLWFIPIIITIVYLLILLAQIKKINNWFIGKNW